MAGTIVTTPALGASDWSSWITQQGLTDRGFMRVSLTNMSGSAASTVGTGSVLECAGAIYSFTDTAITLAAATASASVAVYFVAIPAAGGTTCTVVMDSTAPVWVDAKQGFYASAGSVSRVFGGCYIGTALTYYHKYLYTGDNLLYCLQTGLTRPLLRKVVAIGDWSMTSAATVTIAHGLERSMIRNVSVIVRADVGGFYSDYYNFLSSGIEASVVMEGAVQRITAANIVLARAGGGILDSNSFDATAYNRGWIYIEYEA